MTVKPPFELFSEKVFFPENWALVLRTFCRFCVKSIHSLLLFRGIIAIIVLRLPGAERHAPRRLFARPQKAALDAVFQRLNS